MVLNTMQTSPAWLDLGGAAVKVLLHLMMLSKGNNGFGDEKRDRGALYLSERQAAKATGTSKNTAARALQELIDHGFLAVVTKGAYDVKGLATTWRLTFQPYPLNGMAPTNEWRRWEPEQKPQAQKRTSLGLKTDQSDQCSAHIGAGIEPIRLEGARSLGSNTAPHIYLPRRGRSQGSSEPILEADLDPQFSGDPIAARRGAA
jgi:hypothetical protein